MALFWKKEDKDFHIEIWKMGDLPGSKREREKNVVRTMLKSILQRDIEVQYDKHGKPHIDSHHISITHSGDYVGVIVSETNNVGIDLEKLIEGRIEKVAHRFLTPSENRQDSMRYYYMVWGAKEVLYKIHGTGGLVFSKHIFTEPFAIKEKGKFAAWIKKDGYEKQFTIQYEFINDLLLTFAF